MTWVVTYMQCVSAFVVLVQIVIDAFGYIRGLKAIDLCLQQHNQMRVSQRIICASHKNDKVKATFCGLKATLSIYDGFRNIKVDLSIGS